MTFQAAGGHVRELLWDSCFHYRSSAAALCSCHVQHLQTQHAGPNSLLQQQPPHPQRLHM